MPTPTESPIAPTAPWVQRFVTGAGALFVLLGLAVMAGWHLHSLVLVQVLPGRKLKFEAFNGKGAGDVNGYTAAARVFEL